MDIYKGMLREMGITKTWKWEDASKAILDDDRYNAIWENDEKERLFKEYIKEAKEKEDQEKREMKKA